MQDTHNEPATADAGLCQTADAGDGAPAVAGEHVPAAPLDAGCSAKDDSVQVGAPAADAPRRALKLVLTLRPDDGPGYRALLAFGADGCDPLFRSFVVPTLDAALGEVAGLAAEAEARWLHQLRSPGSAVPRARSAAVRGPSGGVGHQGTAVDAVTSAAAAEAKPAIAAEPGESDSPPPIASRATEQLTLFT